MATLTHETSESVDIYALRVTQAYARLFEEEKRAAETNTSPHSHAWSCFITLHFERGLQPHNILEFAREDPVKCFQTPRARASKHETNNLRGSSSNTPTTYLSDVTGLSPQRQLESNVADLQKTTNQLSRELEKTVRVDPRTHGPDPCEKQGRSQSQDAPKVREEPTAVASPCDYPACRNSDSRSRSECRLEKLHGNKGWTATKTG